LKNKIAREEPSAQAIPIDWGALAATLLVGCAAFWMVASQYTFAQIPADVNVSVINLNARVLLLEDITNWCDRDAYCIPLAADARMVDTTLDPHARVFVSGMLGPTNAPKLGFYYFLRNYLFPREVAISLDGKAVPESYGFSGVPCDSKSVLKTNDFDLLVEVINNELKLTPLTKRGMPQNLTFQYTNIETQLPMAAPNSDPGRQ
jgi:hypothetical protein